MAATDSLPRFFVVYVSHFSSDSMVIPSSYYDHLPRRLPETAILQGTGGCFWNIAMMKNRDGVYFGQGWDKFAEDNLLRDGDILIFVYDGDRIFEVSIFGQGGYKETRAVSEVIDDKEDSVCSLSSEDTKDTSSKLEMANTIQKSKNKGKSKVEVVEDSDEDIVAENSNSDCSYSPDNEDTMTLIKPNVRKSRKKGKSKVEVVEDSDEDIVAENSNCDCSYSPDREGTMTLIKPKARKSRKKVELKIKNPEAYLNDPKNVHFETRLKHRTNELLINSQLAKDYDLKFEEHIEYIDTYGKIKATALKWSDRRVCINKWNQICKRNKLKKEDRIVCELCRDENVVYAIKIHIVRGKDL